MFAESIGNTAKLFFAVSCQSAEEFAEGHCCDSRALLNLAIMGEPAHNGVHYFLKGHSNFHAKELLQNTSTPWLMRIRFTQISLTRLFKRFPFPT